MFQHQIISSVTENTGNKFQNHFFISGWPEHTNDDLSLIQIGLENDATLRVNLVRRHDRQEPQVRETSPGENIC